MTGYIAVTTNDWIDRIRENAGGTAVFWCKKTNFKVLKQGELFFFLRRGSFSSNADRYIVGHGEYRGFFRLPYLSAWDKYKSDLGFDTREKFKEYIDKMYHGTVDEIGCIELENLIFYDKERSLKECNISFSPYTVSGKTIGSEECIRILKYKE